MRMILLLNLLLVLISLEKIKVLLARSLFAMLLVRGLWVARMPFYVHRRFPIACAMVRLRVSRFRASN